MAYMPQMDKLVAVTTENKASVDVFEKSYELALDGCRVASALMRECMITHAKRLYARRQAGPEKPRTVDDLHRDTVTRHRTNLPIRDVILIH